MENNKRWDIKWDIKTTQIGTKFFLNLYFYFARTSRYKVDKINFAYACNTVPFLVVSMRKKYMRLQKIVGSIDFFPEACYGFCKNDLFLKMSKNVWNEGIPIKIMGNSMIGHGCCCVILYVMTNAQCRL